MRENFIEKWPTKSFKGILEIRRVYFKKEVQEINL